MNNYIEYKKVKFSAINFRGRANVKYFIQTQLLRFCKDTANVSSFPLSNQHKFSPCKEEDTNTVY